MKLFTLINAVDGINELIKKELPIKISFKLSKFIKDVDNEVSTFNKIREEKIRKYGEEKDGNIQVKDENKEIFTKEINELLGEEIKIETPLIDINELGDINISINILSKLDFLFTNNN